MFTSIEVGGELEVWSGGCGGCIGAGDYYQHELYTCMKYSKNK